MWQQSVIQNTVTFMLEKSQGGVKAVCGIAAVNKQRHLAQNFCEEIVESPAAESASPFLPHKLPFLSVNPVLVFPLLLDEDSLTFIKVSPHASQKPALVLECLLMPGLLQEDFNPVLAYPTKTAAATWFRSHQISGKRCMSGRHFDCLSGKLNTTFHFNVLGVFLWITANRCIY